MYEKILGWIRIAKFLYPYTTVLVHSFKALEK